MNPSTYTVQYVDAVYQIMVQICLYAFQFPEYVWSTITLTPLVKFTTRAPHMWDADLRV